MKKICVVTGSRADYGLLYWPMKLMIENGFDLKIVATGTHLSSIHGKSIDIIKKDNFKVDCEIDLKIDATQEFGSPKSISSSLALFISKFSEYISKTRPDLLFVLGDRYEIMGAAQVALIYNIPVAHVHGGEVTEGAIDDAFRHSITKMSHLHFVSNEIYKRRVIQLGENSNSVYVVGAPGLDNFKKLKLLSKEDLSKDLELKFNENKKNILVTYHPVTNSELETIQEVKALVASIMEMSNKHQFYVTMPNADTFSAIILKELEKLIDIPNITIIKSLGQIRYLSMLSFVDLVIGNSSSGIIEAPFCGTSVLNLGTRQKGRVTSNLVITLEKFDEEVLKSNIEKVLAVKKVKIKQTSDIYGDGNSSEKIIKILKELKIENVLKKHFNDLD